MIAYIKHTSVNNKKTNDYLKHTSNEKTYLDNNSINDFIREITSNKNNPNLQISEKSLDKKELRDIIKSFRGWVDNQYDRFNSEKKSSKPSKTNPIENILNLKVFNIDLKTIKNGQLIERMCPDVFEALEEIQNMKNTLSES